MNLAYQQSKATQLLKPDFKIVGNYVKVISEHAVLQPNGIRLCS
jgi:hypothetical protein